MAEQRQRGTGPVALSLRPAMKGGAARVGEIVVDDAGLQGAERRSTDALACPMVLRNRYLHRLLHVALGSRGGDDAKEGAARRFQGDDGRGEPAPLHCRLTHQLEELV